MPQVPILYTFYSRNYWHQRQRNAPFLRQFVDLPNGYQQQLPMCGLSIYSAGTIQGDPRNYTDRPFVINKIHSINFVGEDVQLDVEPIQETNIQSVQIINLLHPHRMLEFRESDQVIRILQELGVILPDECIQLLGEVPPPTTCQDWIGEHFKRLNSDNISNNDFEKIVADIFRAISFEVIPMGYLMQGRVPDGVLKAPNLDFAFVYDCKKKNNYYPIADDERAMKEYLENEARKIKEHTPNIKVYPCFIARSFSNNVPERDYLYLTVDNLLCILYKRLKIGYKFSLLPFEEAWKCKRIDKKFIADHWKVLGEV